MNPLSNRRLLRAGACCTTALSVLLLAGCQGRKVVAHVNKATITEEAFNNRAITSKGAAFANTPTLEVGGAVLIEMVREELIHQLAAAKKAEVSKDDLQMLIDYQKHIEPQLASQISSGAISAEDVERQIRLNQEMFAIGTEGAKIDETELKKLYDEQKDQLKVKESFTIKFLAFPSPEMAQKALDLLKQGKTFVQVAQQVLMVSPAQAEQGVRDLALPVDRIRTDQPKLFEILNALQPNQFVAQPAAIAQPNGGGTQYLVAQMISRQPEFTPSYAQARILLQRRKLTETRPNWLAHANSELAAFTQKAEIQISIDRYKPLLTTYILPQAQAEANPAGVVPPGAVETAPPTGANSSAPPQKSTPGAPHKAAPDAATGAPSKTGGR